MKLDQIQEALNGIIKDDLAYKGKKLVLTVFEINEKKDMMRIDNNLVFGMTEGKFIIEGVIL